MQICHSSGVVAAVAFAAAAAVAVDSGNESTNRRTLRARPVLRVEELGETARRANAAPSGAEVFESTRMLIPGAESRKGKACVGFFLCVCC